MWQVTQVYESAMQINFFFIHVNLSYTKTLLSLMSRCHNKDRITLTVMTTVIRIHHRCHVMLWWCYVSLMQFGVSVRVGESHLLCRPGWWWSWVCSAALDISLSPGVCKCCWLGTHLVSHHQMSPFSSQHRGQLPVSHETWWLQTHCPSLWV